MRVKEILESRVKHKNAVLKAENKKDLERLKYEESNAIYEENFRFWTARSPEGETSKWGI